MTRLVPIVLAAALLAGCGGGRTVTAEFASARGLVEGNDVRVDGAVVGSVDAIELTRKGTARVTLSLNDQAPAPRADASAAIRPADLLGDTYVSLAPGRAREALHGALPVARTATAARLDDLLATFDPDVRASLRALLVETGIGLDRRGDDLNRLTLALKPALVEADGVLRNLAAERAALRDVVADAESAARPLAARTADLGASVDRFARVLDETAARPQALGAGLDGLPGMLRDVRSTSRRLASTAVAARPLAEQLRAVAPPLAEVAEGAPQLLQRTRATVRTADPALRSLTGLLRSGRGTLADAGRGLRALAPVAPGLARLAGVIAPAAPAISKGFFDNFADQAAETGRQPFDPFADPARAYWRGAAVFSCESFGVPVEPGCLRKYLGVPARSKRRPERARPSVPETPKLPSAPEVPALPKVPGLPDLPQVTQPAVKPVQDVLDYLLEP